MWCLLMRKKEREKIGKQRDKEKKRKRGEIEEG